jgi:hypothetical protein
MENVDLSDKDKRPESVRFLPPTEARTLAQGTSSLGTATCSIRLTDVHYRGAAIALSCRNCSPWGTGLVRRIPRLPMQLLMRAGHILP